jgi:acetyl-CoA C-acetyltransferase
MMDVAIVGIGIHPFGRHPEISASEMGAMATRQALSDAGMQWSDIQFAFGGSLAPILPDHDNAPMADTLVNSLGLTGVPFVNVANGCATAGSAIALASNAIKSGACDISLAVGFDKHPRGHFSAGAGMAGIDPWFGEQGFMVTTQFFAMKIQRYMHEFGITSEILAKVAAKNFRNGAMNPNAWRRTPFSEEEILNSPMINEPLTQYMFCSPDEGAAAVVLCRADLARQFTHRPVFVRSACLRTRRYGSFEVYSPSLPVERAPSPVVDAAIAAFETAGVAPSDVDVAQLQDSEAGAELMHMAESGLCADGEQEDLVRAGETEIGGRLPINTDGGLIANGEPIGASGMRQVYEIVLQLRGDAGPRQVPGSPRVGFTQVYGAPGVGACAVLTT